MRRPIIDAHIHLDKYAEQDRNKLLQDLDDDQISALIAVSYDLESARTNLALSQVNERVKPAFGFHPEQPLPSHPTMDALWTFINRYQQSMIAIGEVGLPYYLRKEDSSIAREPYAELLEQFVQFAAKGNQPIVLHAVYEDAPLVCDLLEKHSITNAHFHWFKGDTKTITRMKQNGYYISITPDVWYKEEIQELVKAYPVDKIMAETDGPWPFKGPFRKKQTHPNMIHWSVQKIAEIKKMDRTEVYRQVYANTRRFYNL